MEEVDVLSSQEPGIPHVQSNVNHPCGALASSDNKFELGSEQFVRESDVAGADGYSLLDHREQLRKDKKRPLSGELPTPKKAKAKAKAKAASPSSKSTTYDVRILPSFLHQSAEQRSGMHSFTVGCAACPCRTEINFKKRLYICKTPKLMHVSNPASTSAGFNEGMENAWNRIVCAHLVNCHDPKKLSGVAS